MRKWIAVMVVAVGMSMMAVSADAGCGKCEGDKKEHKHEWCGKCGESDKDKCCKEAEKCKSCGYNKGSPGCKHKCAKGE